MFRQQQGNKNILCSRNKYNVTISDPVRFVNVFFPPSFVQVSRILCNHSPCWPVLLCSKTFLYICFYNKSRQHKKEELI